MQAAIFILFSGALAILPAAVSGAADVFQFSAPPGGVYLNASFEQERTEEVIITVEHEGAAVGSWFIAIDNGTSAGYEPRQLSKGTDKMNYQIYKTSSPSASIIKAPGETLALLNVISTVDFGSASASMETQSFSVWFHAPLGQFIPSGTYDDTLTLYLYKGDYWDAATHVPADSATVTVNGRMAPLLDIYSNNEPGIRFMDLTVTQTGKLIATVNERSNSSTGYTVSVTSYNLANDGGGATEPYFLHSSSAGQLTYSLTYNGLAVAPWSAGTAQLTDANGTTSPEWVSKPLAITYSGSTSLPAGDYEDVLTLTISAK